jgi:hypothetical protein
MSITIMSAIFWSEFPEHLDDDSGNSIRAATAKIVMLALADTASDEGKSCYPSIDHLVRKTGVSERGLQKALAVLAYNGLLQIAHRAHDGSHTNEYTIILGAYARLDGHKGFSALRSKDDITKHEYLRALSV